MKTKASTVRPGNSAAATPTAIPNRPLTSSHPQRSPLRAPRTASTDAQDAVEKAIGGEEEDEREQHRCRHGEGGDSKQDREDAAQRDDPPIICEHCISGAREFGTVRMEPSPWGTSSVCTCH